MRGIALIAGLAGALAFGVPTALRAAPTAPGRTTLQAWTLLADADSYVRHRHPSCRDRELRSSWSHDAPSDELLGMLEVMRRPPRPEERLSLQEARAALSGVGVYLDWVRIVRNRFGAELYVFGSQNANIDVFGPPACGRIERRRLDRLLADQPAHVARLARRYLAAALPFKYPDRPPSPAEGVSLFEARPTRTAQGSVQSGTSSSVDQLREVGVWSTGADGRRHTVLVPDGVATITAVYPRRGHRPLFGTRKVFDEQAERTATVAENVAAFRAPRGGIDAFPTRVVWRAADGSVVRRTTSPWFEPRRGAAG